MGFEWQDVYDDPRGLDSSKSKESIGHFPVPRGTGGDQPSGRDDCGQRKALEEACHSSTGVKENERGVGFSPGQDEGQVITPTKQSVLASFVEGSIQTHRREGCGDFNPLRSQPKFLSIKLSPPPSHGR